MKDSLKIIQTLSKIGKICSQISFVCSLVGFGLCIGGMVLKTEALKLNGVTIHRLLDVNLDTTTFLSFLIVCLGQAILSYFAKHYFTRELKDGTPFHLEGAKEMFRLGILTICISLITEIICTLLQHESMGLHYVQLGVTFIILSIIFRYGAENRN